MRNCRLGDNLYCFTTELKEIREERSLKKLYKKKEKTIYSVHLKFVLNPSILLGVTVGAGAYRSILGRRTQIFGTPFRWILFPLFNPFS